MSDFSDLIADAQAIPAAAFQRARCAVGAAVATAIDLTVPAQRPALPLRVWEGLAASGSG